MQPARRRPLCTFALVFLLYTSLTALFTYPQVRFLRTGVSDPVDPLLNVWTIAWIAHQLPRDPAHLFDANIFHPERRTLAYSEALLVPALLTAPLIWAGAEPVLAHNLLQLSGFVLSGVGTFLLVRSLTGRNDAAVLAGIFFAFQPFRIDHYPHLQLQMTQFMPLALWSLHRTVAEGRLRDGLLAGLFTACNALSCLYYGVFFTTYLALVALAMILGLRRAPLSRVLGALAGGGALLVLLVLPAARAYLANTEQMGQRSEEQVLTGSAEPRNYLATSAHNTLYGWTSARFGKNESRLFPGVTMTALAVLGVVPPASPAAVVYGLGTAFAFDMSLGFNGSTYPTLYRTARPFRGIRVPARAGILVGLSLSILSGFGFLRLARRFKSRRAGWAVASAIALLAVLEYRPAPLDLFHVWRSVPAVYQALASEHSGAILELPLDIHETAYMYFSTKHWQPLLNGYSGFFPKSHGELREKLGTFPDEDSVSYLERRGVRFLVLHEKFYQAGQYASLVESLRHRPEFETVVTSRWEGAEVKLYRVVRR